LGGYKTALKRAAHLLLDPIVRGALALGLRANHVTAIGFTLSLGAGIEFAAGRFRVAAALATLSGVCDILDGQLARVSGRVTRFGAFLDSTLDRFAEAALLLGVATFYALNLADMAGDPARVLANRLNGLEPITWAILALTAVLALVGSLMVSYTRARAEGLGLECKVGWFERPERMVLLIIAGFAGLGPVMPAVLILLVVFSFTTAIQRMVHVWKLTRRTGSGSTEA
jgi:CDP-diacylglycerol--glycerol-3-phosphate 3-phosphatidyltransferase